jgi:virginiamycin A acetyltransferase
MSLREFVKRAALVLATVVVSPALVSYWIRALVIGSDRALQGSTQWLALVPGLPGQYLRRAFLCQVLEAHHWTATVEAGTLFARVKTRIEENVYIGAACHLGSVHLERNVLLAAGVHVPSGQHTHGTARTDVLIRDQAETPKMVRIGKGTWVGAGAIVMADVGRDSVIGAGAVVTKTIPDRVVAAGIPATVIRQRDST